MLAKDLTEMGDEIFAGDENYKEFMTPDGKLDSKRFGDVLLKTIDNRDLDKLDKLKEGFMKRMDSEQGRKFREEVNRERAERYNDGIPKDKKFKASPEARSFVASYERYMRGIDNAYQNIHAEAMSDVASDRNLTQQLGEHDAKKKRIAAGAKKAKEAKTAEERAEAFKDMGDYGQFVLDVEGALGQTNIVDYENMEKDGFPAMSETVENKLYKVLRDKQVSGQITDGEKKVLDTIVKRKDQRKAAEEKPKSELEGMYRNPDEYGGSKSQSVNKAIYDECQRGIESIKAELIKKDPKLGGKSKKAKKALKDALRNDPRYVDLHNAQMATRASSKYNEASDMMVKYKEDIIASLDADGYNGAEEYERMYNDLIASRKAIAQKWKAAGKNTQFYDVKDVPEWTDLRNSYDAIKLMVKDIRRS